MKKIKLILSILALSMVFHSCSKDESIESIEDPNILTENDSARIINPNQSGHSGNVFVAIVNEGPCGLSKYIYSIYASASETYPQDREVQAAVVKNGAIIEAKTVIIPAGQHVSNNVVVFNGSSSSVGNVYSRAFNVLVNGQIVSGYTYPKINHNVSNCFTGPSTSNCNLGIYPADDPNTTANEGPGDEDEDGECNRTDIDDNGNDIPDEWED